MSWFKKLFSLQDEDENEKELEPKKDNTTVNHSKNLQTRVTYQYPKNQMPDKEKSDVYTRRINERTVQPKNERLDNQSRLYKRYPRLQKRDRLIEQNQESVAKNVGKYNERIEHVKNRDTIRQYDEIVEPQEMQKEPSTNIKKIEGVRYFQPTEIPSPVFGFQKVRTLEEATVEFELDTFDGNRREPNDKQGVIVNQYRNQTAPQVNDSLSDKQNPQHIQMIKAENQSETIVNMNKSVTQNTFTESTEHNSKEQYDSILYVDKDYLKMPSAQEIVLEEVDSQRDNVENWETQVSEEDDVQTTSETEVNNEVHGDDVNIQDLQTESIETRIVENHPEINMDFDLAGGKDSIFKEEDTTLLDVISQKSTIIVNETSKLDEHLEYQELEQSFDIQSIEGEAETDESVEQLGFQKQEEYEIRFIEAETKIDESVEQVEYQETKQENEFQSIDAEVETNEDDKQAGLQNEEEEFETHPFEAEVVINDSDLYDGFQTKDEEFEIQSVEAEVEIAESNEQVSYQVQAEISENQLKEDEHQRNTILSINNENQNQVEELNIQNNDLQYLLMGEEQKFVSRQNENAATQMGDEQILQTGEAEYSSDTEVINNGEVNTKTQLINDNLLFSDQVAELLHRAKADQDDQLQPETDDQENPMNESLVSVDEELYKESDRIEVVNEEFELEKNDETNSFSYSSYHEEQKNNEIAETEVAASLSLTVEKQTGEEVQIEQSQEANKASVKSDNDVNGERRPVKRHVPFNVLMLKSDKERLKEREKRRKREEQQALAKMMESETTKEQGIQEIEKSYEFPAHHLLDLTAVEHSNEEWIEEQTTILNNTLHSFHVGATVVDVSVGPAVTRFELTPELGVKVSKITNLTDDLKLSLAAKDIRIEAPIPGKHTIGIEVPNKNARPVFLREILDQNEFIEASSPLTVALGLDIGGKPIVTDLKKMPHGLIAGATGSGKSVCINTFIVSLLYKANPEEVKLLMIDPKMVELAPYNGIPHLLSPVITDVKAATQALKWSVEEMERRYELFVHAGVRDIGKFNEKANDDQKLPYIVIIIDELADLMMMAPTDVEEAIARIAQKARACGIHLIIATQRPSVDVITGLIKANVPTRIAFSVSSQIDSRTIIDISGAERLLGKGDMLFMENGTSKPIRVQGAFITDEEIERVVDHVRNQGEPQYLFKQEELIRKSDFAENSDELLFDACEYAVQQGQLSTSSLQRRFRIGYNRAARIIELMEEKGMVSEAKGSKPRDVLMTDETLEQLKDLI